MGANDEVGTLNPLAEMGAICKSRGVLFHRDGVQAVGKAKTDVELMGIDLPSLSGYKLYVRSCYPRVRIKEQNRRWSTRVRSAHRNAQHVRYCWFGQSL